MKNKKTIILSIIAVITLLTLIIGATYAYFQASGGTGTSANLRVTTYTTDIITFEVGSNINIETNATLFSQGKGNATGTTFARATLTANNKTNSATENYNLFLNISDNTFAYSVDTNTPELILTIKDKSNNEVTSIEGLTYKIVTDGKGTTIKGFDITNKNGLLTLFNKDITTTSTTVEEWNVTVTFVNYNKDQTKNAGKKFDAQLIISKDNFSDYTPNTINTLSASKSGNNLTVNLNLENGSNPIDKYYYAIEETNGLAILDSKASIKRLSNRLAVSNLTYVESNNSSYTFTNIKTDANYNVYAYAVDNKKVKTNTYNYKYTSNYNLPVISKVETSKTSNSITATVTATKGTNSISKYYYSKDNGSTFTESTSNSYTFNNLSNNTNYRIVVKVMDTNGKYSNTYVVSQKIGKITKLIKFKYLDTEYTAENGMTLAEWAESNYNTFGYYIDDTDLIEENKSYGDTNFCRSNGESFCSIRSLNGAILQKLTEINIKEIYDSSNYNAIGKVFGYFSRDLPLQINKIVDYADGLSSDQVADLSSVISELNGYTILSPAFVVDAHECDKTEDGNSIIKLTVSIVNSEIKEYDLLIFDYSGTFSLSKATSVDIENKLLTFEISGYSVAVLLAK